MATHEELSEDKAAWHHRRRKMRRTLWLTIAFLPAVSAVGLWRDEQDYQHWRQQATQYQQECANPTTASQSCQVLPMKVYEHASKVSLDPDQSEPDPWLGVQSKSGQTYKAEIYNPHWSQLKVGDAVTVTVWKGKVERISGGGITTDTPVNPVLKAEGARSGVTYSWVFLGIGLCVSGLLYWGDSRIQRKLRTTEPGNDPGA